MQIQGKYEEQTESEAIKMEILAQLILFNLRFISEKQKKRNIFYEKFTFLTVKTKNIN